MISSPNIATTKTTTVKSRFVRVLLATLGVVCVIVAAIGVVMPGIPTLGPLILASILFTKSFPELERRLVRHKFFAAYVDYIDGNRPISKKARYWALLMMWTSILISCIVFHVTGSPGWVWAIMIALGMVGTYFIFNFRRQLRSAPNENNELAE